MSEWISVKDRLPDKNGDYLVCGHYWFNKKDKFINICGYSNNLYKLDKYDFDDFKYAKDKRGFYSYDSEWGYSYEEGITHWMELPSFPKEGD